MPLYAQPFLRPAHRFLSIQEIDERLQVSITPAIITTSCSYFPFWDDSRYPPFPTGSRVLFAGIGLRAPCSPLLWIPINCLALLLCETRFGCCVSKFHQHLA